ncbi:MAG: shikimate kinase [Verrucomicrobia bacterium]|nr:shikimate kinase [Verrucomicrobiota bacterium]
MQRIVIFGNSGSGKSTLAKAFARKPNVKHLDLDTIAWKNEAERENLAVSLDTLRCFIMQHDEWVIEGCYGALIEEAVLYASEIIFLNPGTKTCLENCLLRKWEPHKYSSKEAQDKHLATLWDWVAQYESRSDEFSYTEHRRIFEGFVGTKREINANLDLSKIPGVST